MSKSHEWYDINDVDLFVESTRVLVYSSFGANTTDSPESINIDIKKLNESELLEMNKCLSQKESMTIAKEFLKLTKKRSIISDKNYFKFIEALNSRMISNMLVKLTQDGLLESAFDEESNDFIFWIKDETTTKKEEENDL